MTFLALLLVLKIAVTLLIVSLPMLALPPERLGKSFHIGADAVPLARLYGVSITALLVGYAGGFAPAAAGVFPWSVVIMGIVSNGGATLVLIVMGGWRRSLTSPIIFGTFTVALIAAALFPAAALTRAF